MHPLDIRDPATLAALLEKSALNSHLGRAAELMLSAPTSFTPIADLQRAAWWIKRADEQALDAYVGPARLGFPFAYIEHSGAQGPLESALQILLGPRLRRSEYPSIVALLREEIAALSVMSHVSTTEQSTCRP